MRLTEQIYAQALLLTQDATEKQLPMLEILCRTAENSLRGKLRDGISPEDCMPDFVASASLYALAALSELDEDMQMDQIRLGDVTLRRGSTNAAACCLRYQADQMMAPYVKDSFAFMGV